MIPDQLPADAPDSEKIVYTALSQLDDSWTVIWSVSWQSERNRREGDGEADFIIASPRHGAVVIEVKGGGIDVRGGEWSSIDRFGNVHSIKNPYDQAVASKHALLRFISTKIPGGHKFRLGHAVAFPNIALDHLVTPYATPEISLDESKLGSIDRFVRGLVRHWELQSQIGAGAFRQFINFLRPTVTIRVNLRTIFGEIKEELLKLTAEQIRVLTATRANRRMAIHGVAGSGKTVLAVEKAREFSSAGLNTLVVCYNRPLADWLSSLFDSIPTVRVSTFHTLCLSEASSANIQTPGAPDSQWYEVEAANVLTDAAQENQTCYDAIVIDEGQDFSDEWLTSLQLLLRDPDTSPLYIFLDNHQQLYRNRLTAHESWPQHQLLLNCRNTEQIASPVARVFDDDVLGIGAQGPEPTLQFVSGLGAALEEVQDKVYSLIKNESIDPSQITVLTDTNAALAALANSMAGDTPFHTGDGAGVYCSTIHRFKGLESDVVIVLLEGEPERVSEKERELMYVALSRARFLLCLVANDSWAGLSRSIFEKETQP